MKRLLRLVLLVGAFMGLLLQTAAYAAGPDTDAVAVQSAKIDADCMEKMQQHEGAPDKKACHGLTLKCIATMGCVTSVGLPGDFMPVLQRQFAASQAFWTTSPVLSGNDPSPEHHPPPFLG